MRSEADEAQLGFVAALVASRSRELGAGAAGRLASEGGVQGAGDRAVWTENLTARAMDLAGSVGAGRPEIFAGQVAWSVVALRARGLDVGPLTRGLSHLRCEVLASMAPEDRALVGTYFAAAEARLAGNEEDPPAELSLSTPAGEIASRYLLHVLEGNRREACSLVTRAVEDGRLTVRSAYRDVFTPVLREVGRLWHVGDVTVAEEHFVTATTLMAMSLVLPLAQTPPPIGRTMISASVAGNHHEVGARMVADTFEIQGWRAVFLGANVPAEDLARAAADFQADVAALSVALPGQLAALGHAVGELRRVCPKIRIVAGGAAFAQTTSPQQLARDYGADVLGRDPEDCHRLVIEMLEARVP